MVKNPFPNSAVFTMFFICVVVACACSFNVTVAYAADLTAANVNIPPNATQVIKYKDGNYYALYKDNVCALTKIKHHAKTITVPKNIKVNGRRYKVIAIHELQLWERKDIKKVTIKATNMETVEDPALFKDWRNSHNIKIKVKVTNKTMRQWLNAKW